MGSTSADGGPKGSCHRFKKSLDLVVGVRSMENRRMKIAVTVFGEGPPHVLNHFRRKVADLAPLKRCIKATVATTGQVNHGSDKGIVHWNVGVPIAGDVRLLTEGLVKCLSQPNRHVLDGVVLVNFQIPVASNVEIKCSMLGKEVKHVIKKPDPGLDIIRSIPVDFEFNRDTGFRCRPLYNGTTGRKRIGGHSM